jgi:hypothetical protein
LCALMRAMARYLCAQFLFVVFSGVVFLQRVVGFSHVFTSALFFLRGYRFDDRSHFGSSLYANQDAGGVLSFLYCADWCRLVQTGADWCRLVRAGADWCGLVRTGADWCRLVQTGADWCRLVQTGADWCRLVQTGADWCRLVQTGADWCRFVRSLVHFDWPATVFLTWHVP